MTPARDMEDLKRHARDLARGLVGKSAQPPSRWAAFTAAEFDAIAQALVESFHAAPTLDDPGGVGDRLADEALAEQGRRAGRADA